MTRDEDETKKANLSSREAERHLKTKMSWPGTKFGPGISKIGAVRRRGAERVPDSAILSVPSCCSRPLRHWALGGQDIGLQAGKSFGSQLLRHWTTVTPDDGCEMTERGAGLKLR